MQPAPSPSAARTAGDEVERQQLQLLKWRTDNRLALPGLLHRISAVRNTQRHIVGLTYRVGRHRPGVGRLLLDHLAGEGPGGQGGGGRRETAGQQGRLW